MPYKHITCEERVKIETLRNEGYAKNEIAERLHRHRSSIGRELERNWEGVGGPYKATRAERRRRTVRAAANQTHRKLIVGNKLERRVEEGLRRFWSPEQIAGRLRLEHRGDTVLCHETIYRFLHTKRTDLLPLLRQGHKRRYRRRHGTKQRELRREQRKKRSIDIRPKIVDRRGRFGDWEGDTVIGDTHNIDRVLTHVERKSGYFLADKISGQGPLAETVRRKAAARFRRLPKHLRRTVTYDNGIEFSDHERIERDGKITPYFAHPYCSWERPLNENQNGLLRQFLPKGSSFQRLTQKRLDHYVKLINSRPRKRHGYHTPEEVLSRHVAV